MTTAKTPCVATARTVPLSNGRDIGPLLARFQCRDEEGRSCAPLLGAVSSRPFKSLGDFRADTLTPHGRLMLTVLSSIAAFEHDLILQRTNEGRVRALLESVRFGRKPKLTKHQAREALKRVAEGEPLREIALSYNVHHSTIHRLKARYAAEV